MLLNNLMGFFFFRRSKTEYPQMNGEMEATTQDQGGFFAKSSFSEELICRLIMARQHFT